MATVIGQHLTGTHVQVQFSSVQTTDPLPGHAFGGSGRVFLVSVHNYSKLWIIPRTHLVHVDVGHPLAIPIPQAVKERDR